MIARYIIEADLNLYQHHGWRCTWYGFRGDGLACFIASFRCCQ